MKARHRNWNEFSIPTSSLSLSPSISFHYSWWIYFPVDPHDMRSQRNELLNDKWFTAGRAFSLSKFHFTLVFCWSFFFPNVNEPENLPRWLSKAISFICSCSCSCCECIFFPRISIFRILKSHKLAFSHTSWRAVFIFIVVIAFVVGVIRRVRFSILHDFGRRS